MPVRIYDISKKLGLENKDVLAKAKELGISAAKVPSSSLDKITAEYLENELTGGRPVAATPPAPPAEPEKIILVTAPPPKPEPIVEPPPMPVTAEVETAPVDEAPPENGEAATHVSEPPTPVAPVTPPPAPTGPQVG